MNALQHLRDLDHQHQREKYPEIRPELLARRKFSDKTANGLTACIIHFIRLKGGQSERISIQGRVIDRRKVVTDCLGFRRVIGSVDRIRSSMQPGSADVAAILPGGKSLKIEIKINSDRQSEKQKLYQRQVEAAGGLYYIAKDFESFYQWYQNNFEPTS